MCVYEFVYTHQCVCFTPRRYPGEWSASLPGCFVPKETALIMHWVGGWVSPQSWFGHDDIEEISATARNLTL